MFVEDKRSGEAPADAAPRWLTLQEVFDRSVGPLLRQGEASRVSLFAACAYRGPRNLRCAVGWLISDAAYDPIMEADVGIDVNVLAQEALKQSSVDANSLDVLVLLKEMQLIHDTTSASTWVISYRELAVRYGLSPAICGGSV